MESSKATKGKSVSTQSKKKVIPGGKTSYQGKVAIKIPVKETNWRKHTPRKVAGITMSPQTFQVQSQKGISRTKCNGSVTLGKCSDISDSICCSTPLS